MLTIFSKSLTDILNQQNELQTSLQQMRSLLTSALSDDNFRLDCITHVLDSIESWGDTSSAWNAPAIIHHEDLIYSIRIVYWPAFYENNPHKHKTWGLTGVLHNQLDVNIYEFLDNPRRLRRERKISASSGEVGYLLPGCIHNINNPSHELSASIHIFNNLPGIENPEENAVWYPAPRKHKLYLGLTERALTTCLAIASSITSQHSQKIIERIYTMSPDSVKLLAIKSLCTFNSAIAKQRFNELADYL